MDTNLNKSFARLSTLLSCSLTGVVSLLTLVALIPLISILGMLILKGLPILHYSTLTSLPPSAFEEGGGFGNAIVGTLVMVGMATMVSVPIGILSAVYLAEIAPESMVARWLRFCAKILSGFPSILAGVFIYGSVVILCGGFSAVAGSLALAILMLPTIVLTSEEAMRSVPIKLKEAAIAIGTTQTQTILKIVLPTALPSILTGILLAISRAAGETAPLLFTSLFSNYWIYDGSELSMMRPTASLAVLIFNFSGTPFENQVQMAWGASLVLVLIVLVTNLTGKYFSRRFPLQ